MPRSEPTLVSVIDAVSDAGWDVGEIARHTPKNQPEVAAALVGVWRLLDQAQKTLEEIERQQKERRP